VLGGCGESGSEGRDAGDDGGSRRNIVVKTVYADACLPRPLVADAEGRTTRVGSVEMSVVEMMPGACDCSRPARASSPLDEILAIYDELRAAQVCGESTGVACSDYCGCRILELAGSSSDPTSPLYACQNHTTVSDASIVGFCYVAPGRVDENGMPAPLGNPELAAICDPTQYQRLRFVGADTPFPGAHVFAAASNAPPP
jgi:hypothetical protein